VIINRPLSLNLYYGSGRYQVRHQYLTYDAQSLVADIGGYLGLLLGHSVLSFYDIARGIWRQQFTRATSQGQTGRGTSMKK
jgi:hypothetical protein